MTGRVEVEMRVGKAGCGAVCSMGAMMAAFLLPFKHTGSASTCISSASLAAMAARVVST